VTIREYLRRRVLIGYGLFALGVLYFILIGNFLEGKSEDADFLVVPGVALVVGGILYLNYALRCPSCKGNLAISPAAYPFTFAKRHRFNYCPYCGVSADRQPDDTSK
jgi:hypothetical protein